MNSCLVFGQAGETCNATPLLLPAGTRQGRALRLSGRAEKFRYQSGLFCGLGMRFA
jgi:hypothetical protein